ncbi:MAG TPA: NmrA/HSCARG family protein [Chitinivibrionales bacterium]|nr:NmrA/HSCARG family protein [Chitinivibrionales bacterium]
MDHKGKTILVAGATGKQGGAVARRLLSKGWQVRALVRNPDADAAQSLGKAGAEIIKGDLNDVSSLERAVAGVYGAFSVQTFREGVERETEQGKNLASAASRAEVVHFVYSSVGSANRNTGIPHFESKWKVEQHIVSLGLTATIFRPVSFMENFIMPQSRESILAGTLAMGLDPGKPLQMIAVSDIAEFVSLAFESPSDYAGKAVDLAGDELTGPEIARRFGEALGIGVAYVQMPLERLRGVSEDLAIMTEWFNKTGYRADIPSLRKIHPGLKTLAAWITATGWNKPVAAAAHA